MSVNELGTNSVPQYSNFNIKFNVTKDGGVINMNTISAWIFAMAEGTPQGTRHILKASTGTTTSGDFVVSTGDRTVTVTVRPTEFGSRSGIFYVNLHAESSGTRITHLEEFINVKPVVSSSGI